MKISDTIPQKPEFELNGKKYALNLLTLEDLSYFEDKYGSLQDLLDILSSEGKFKEKCEIIYAQLDDKSDFLSKEIEKINREGVKEKKTINGPQSFASHISLKDIYAPLNAFMKAIELSTPKALVDDKKKQKGK